MAPPSKALAFDVDRDSITTLRGALTDWEVEPLSGVTIGSLDRDWNPGKAALLVVGARHEAAETLGLCRGLRGQTGRVLTPLLVLVRPGQDGLVRSALAAGAHGCLVMPIHAKRLLGMVGRARAGNRPGRHTLNLERTQCEDRWRDDGGQG